MKKVKKNCNLSSVYKDWEQNFEANGKAHPKYNSSAGEYYYDIVMNLFHCQGGLCAYTEVRLCTENFFCKTNWTENRYTIKGGITSPPFLGQLDHFDSTLKTTKGWLWDNFFMVESNINSKVKRSNPVDQILKPDSEGYNEFQLLEYNIKLNIFIANTDLSSDEQDRINKMILILGINYDPIQYKRASSLKTIVDRIKFGIETWDSINIDEFPTAFEMTKRQLNK